MKDFIEHIALKKANYYYELYVSTKRAERRDECLKRIQTIDEYTFLLDIIEYLPPDIKAQVDQSYEENLADLKVLHGRN